MHDLTARLARYAAARLGRDAAADLVQTVLLRAVKARRRIIVAPFSP